MAGKKQKKEPKPDKKEPSKDKPVGRAGMGSATAVINDSA